MMNFILGALVVIFGLCIGYAIATEAQERRKRK